MSKRPDLRRPLKAVKSPEIREPTPILTRKAVIQGLVVLAAAPLAVRPLLSWAADPGQPTTPSPTPTPATTSATGTLDDGTLHIEEVAPGLFVHQSINAVSNADNGGDIANISIIIGTDSVAVVDTGGSAKVGTAVAATVRKMTDRPIRYVINTHMHPDHVLGNGALRGVNVEYVGHHKLPAALAARAETYLRRAHDQLGDELFAGTQIVSPTRVVRDTDVLKLGGRDLTLTARPTAHTDNDLTIRDSATDTLLLGDLLFSGHVPTLDGSIKGWLALIDVLVKEPAARVVPGHGPTAMPWPDAIAPLKTYWEVVARDVRAAIADGKTMTEANKTAGQSEKDKWALFDEHHIRNVNGAFAELEWE